MALAMPGDSTVQEAMAALKRGGGGMLRVFLETAPLPTFLSVPGGGVVFGNAAFGALLGYTAEECVGLLPQDFVHADDMGLVRQQVEDASAGRIVRYQGERRFLHKNGEIVWGLSSAAVLPDDDGRPAYLIVQIVDIDAKKRAEAALAISESRWNVALESAGQGVWDYDLAGGRAFFSKMWFLMRGLDPADGAAGHMEAWLGRVHPEDRDRVRETVRRQNAGETPIASFEYREQHHDGHVLWILSRGRAVERFADGRPSRVLGTDTDVTSLKDAEARLQFANTLLMTEMETSPDGILVVNAAMKIISFNRRFADMWRIPVEVLEAGEDGPILAAVFSAQSDPEGFLRRVKYLYEHPEEDGHDELVTNDGRFIDRHTSALKTASGDYLGRVWFFRDISERKQAEEQILRSARCDALTGLANRTVFMAAVEHAIAVAKRNDTGFAVLFLDLDQFKDVNDTMGHPVGDDLIRAVADRLRANVRAADIVARFGGDEFAVMVSDVEEPIDAAVLSEKIIKAIGESFSIRGNLIRTAVSIGVSLFAPDEPDAETMLSRADLALYRAKAEGPGGYRFFTTAMENEVRARVSLDSELREAIAAGQFHLAYQPQVEIGTGRITGVEALVRWRHPVRGLVPPKVFIPVAERSGFIAELGRWVLKESCRQMKLWLEAGIAPDLTAINLSAVQFKGSFDLEGDIAAALAASGLPPSMLELELTETVLMAASGDHNDMLQRFRRDGIRLAIDDFGVGYSSFDYLRRFPVHRIKIAQDFVERIATAYGSAAIVRATIGLCRELGISVIAEGVETAEQYELLQEWGCREAQGFYFARPLDAADVAPLLAAGVIQPGSGQRARSAA
jgi:diguanylate cyclase (GGDEF)-like protein/PAS domain S-box-containing protein